MIARFRKADAGFRVSTGGVWVPSTTSGKDLDYFDFFATTPLSASLTELATAQRAANQSTNTSLGGAIRSVRARLTNYIAALHLTRPPLDFVTRYTDPLLSAEADARTQCEKIGMTVQPMPLIGGKP